MVQTDSVEAIFTEQHSTTVGPSFLIIQSPMVTSPMVEVVVSAGYDTHIGEDDWVGDG